ncbi:hypothetical protein Aazo_4990 ['Nostoc azollae' 0708]|jgi:hypothetical protein|uniref:Uncharacterized protein n=1 Tax=Nostoc azollae (strain 0708) TaxID=551115 RepID=D7DZ89_NOSA0|nr:hypothetical protein Aazo_4990 ['Nostoc azollae' 0708]
MPKDQKLLLTTEYIIFKEKIYRYIFYKQNSSGFVTEKYKSIITALF